MAAPVDLTSATTCEGQLAMILEMIINLQANTTVDTGSNRDNVTVITTNTINEITGLQAVTISLPISSIGSANGFSLVADEVYYPKVV